MLNNLSNKEIAEKLHLLYFDNYAALLHGDKKRANKIVAQIMKIYKYLDENYEKMPGVLCFLGLSKDIFEKCFHIQLCISFGINIDDAFETLRAILLKKPKNAIDIITYLDYTRRKLLSEGHYEFFKNQKNLAKYDKKWLKKMLGDIPNL